MAITYDCKRGRTVLGWSEGEGRGVGVRGREGRGEGDGVRRGEGEWVRGEMGGEEASK